MTNDDDIGFAAYYDPSGSAEALTNMDCVFPYIRLECSNVCFWGHIFVLTFALGANLRLNDL